MLSKLVFVLLGAVLILQGYNAAPYQNMESSVNALRERLKLVHIYSTELNEILYLVLGNCKSLLERILSAPEVLAVETDSMKANLEELKAILKTYDEFEKAGKHDRESGMKLAGLFNEIEKKYDVKKPLEKEEDKVIANFIKETGFERLSDPIKERIKAFMDKFYNEVQTYVDGLNEVEKQEETVLIELLAKRKAQPDFIKQGDFIRDLIEGFDLEEFVW